MSMPPRAHPTHTAEGQAQWQFARWQANNRVADGTDTHLPAIRAAIAALAAHDEQAKAARDQMVRARDEVITAAVEQGGFAYVDIAGHLGMRANTIRNIVQAHRYYHANDPKPTSEDDEL